MFSPTPAATVLSVSLFVLSGCALSGSEEAERLSETAQVAQASFAVGDYPEAAQLYEKVSQTEPGSVSALIGLGRSYAAMGQIARAQSALDRARQLSPRNPQVLNELGRLALGQGNAAQALDFYEASLGYDRKNLAALTGKAVTLDYLSRHTEARAVYETGLAIYPTNFVLLSNHALSRVLSGDGAGGIALMEELRRDPVQGSQVVPNLAIAQVLEGRSAEARKVLKGQMSEAQIPALLRRAEEARRIRAGGQPIGHLVFQ